MRIQIKGLVNNGFAKHLFEICIFTGCIEVWQWTAYHEAVDVIHKNYKTKIYNWQQWPRLLTWINFDPSMEIVITFPEKCGMQLFIHS